MQSYEKNTTLQTPWQFRIEILSHIGFLAAIVLAAWFHDLRTTFGESAMRFYNLVNTAECPTFSIHWFQDWMTILAVKSGFSLSFISLVFSASPVIFAYGIFSIINYVFKQKNAGIFYLLLLLGINQTFFQAVHTPLILAISGYFCMTCLMAVWKRFRGDLNPLVELGIWALICLFFFVPVSPNTYSDVIVGTHSFSFLSYFSSVAMGSFVIAFGLVGYMALYWIARKEFKTLILFGIWAIVIVGYMTFFGRKILLDIDWELFYFPLIAGITGFFFFTFRNVSQSGKGQFVIFLALVIFAVFGQLRTFSEFEKRNAAVVKLLRHAPETAEKYALPEDFQQLEKYIDPTYLAFETPLIASLSGLPNKSIYFIPTPSETKKSSEIPVIPTLSENVNHTSFFDFPNSEYIVSDTPFVKRTLYQPLYCDFDAVEYRGDLPLYVTSSKETFLNVPLQTEETLHKSTAVFTGHGCQYAMILRLPLERGDSLALSVWRKGADVGHLIISDNRDANALFWVPEQRISEPNEKGWKKLSTNLILPEKGKYRFYVWNEKYMTEVIYFDEFRIDVWRE